MGRSSTKLNALANCYFTSLECNITISGMSRGSIETNKIVTPHASNAAPARTIVDSRIDTVAILRDIMRYYAMPGHQTAAELTFT